jgi:hypothetical protein
MRRGAVAALFFSAIFFSAIFFSAALSLALRQSAAQAAGLIRLAQSSAVTNCMMACNSQAANCLTTCLIPGTPPIGAATTGSNANQSTACQLNCTTQRMTCQTGCARTSPSP